MDERKVILDMISAGGAKGKELLVSTVVMLACRAGTEPSVEFFQEAYPMLPVDDQREVVDELLEVAEATKQMTEIAILGSARK